MEKRAIRNIFAAFGLDTQKITEKISRPSLIFALRENGLLALVEKLRKIVPDISKQESSGTFNDYWKYKRRGLQAFQCSLMLKALDKTSSGRITVVDIGDSAGTHMLYLKELLKGRFNIDTVSVNLDPRAIKKIQERGLKAMLCRAEDLDLGGSKVDLFTSFQMVEHLHDPAIFFRHLAKKSKGDRMAITVPYLRRSRVGLHNLRSNRDKKIYAEDEHIFELSPEDWRLLMLHSGWRVTHSEIYYQYPRHWPLISWAMARYWNFTDYEGFWGAILEKDTSASDRYQDWSE